MKKLCIIGAGGHGRVIADLARVLNKYDEIFFLDDNKEQRQNYYISGRIRDYDRYLDSAEFIVAIGENSTRKSIIEMLNKKGACLATLVHPQSYVSKDTYIENGTVIMAGCVVNAGTRIEQGVILNTCSSVDHNCNIGEFTHIAVGAHLCGSVNIGKQCMIGAGSTIINNISVCDECILGAGCVVVNAVDEKGTYIGVPARKKI